MQSGRELPTQLLIALMVVQVGRYLRQEVTSMVEQLIQLWETQDR